MAVSTVSRNKPWCAPDDTAMYVWENQFSIKNPKIIMLKSWERVEEPQFNMLNTYTHLSSQSEIEADAFGV